jgi:hypothetical protein
MSTCYELDQHVWSATKDFERRAKIDWACETKAYVTLGSKSGTSDPGSWEIKSACDILVERWRTKSGNVVR